MNDNRNYKWNAQVCHRPEYPFIEQWIPEGASVIDLGCGNGSLLAMLKEKKKVDEFGIEIAPSGVEICHQRKLKARQGRIDVALDDIPDAAFDFAICNMTLQMVMYPEVTLKEMKRISRYQIVSFPNFAFVLNRLELLLLGRMPRRMLSGYSWYNTGHIHQFSILDFKNLCAEFGLKTQGTVYLSKLKSVCRLRPNLLAQNAIFLLRSLSAPLAESAFAIPTRRPFDSSNMAVGAGRASHTPIFHFSGTVRIQN